MSEGWIKLHRKLLHSPLVSKPDHFTVWVVMLMMANHEDRHIIFNRRKMLVKSGSFITSRLKISTRCKIQESKVKRIIDYLKSDQQIEQVRLGIGSLFSITNWDKYQSHEQQSDQRVTNECPMSDQRVTTNKNDKNVKKTTSFDEFWSLYPKKVGKGAALKAWTARHCENGLLDKIRSTLAWEVKCEQWTKDGGQFIPLPATWLNQERWNDEPTPEATKQRKLVL